MLQGPVHIVDDGKEVLEEVFIAVFYRIGLFPGRAFFIIIEFGDRAQILVVIFRSFLLFFLQLFL